MKPIQMARCAMLAVLMCLCAWISIPLGEIAVTMQTFGLFLTLGLLGGRHGSLVCLLYLLLGAVGLPVFSGFRGGLGVLLGPAGGYIAGFLAGALVYWLTTACLGSGFWARLAGCLGCLCACYAFGTAWFLRSFLSEGNAVSLGAVLLKCVLPYLLPDLVKLTVALALTKRLKRIISPSQGT